MKHDYLRWDIHHRLAVAAEGEKWDVRYFDGRWCLMAQLGQHESVRRLIERRAKEGSKLHQRALALLTLQR